MRPDLTISPLPSSGLNIGLYIFNVNKVTVLFKAPLKELKIALNKIAAKTPISDAGNKSTISRGFTVSAFLFRSHANEKAVTPGTTI